MDLGCFNTEERCEKDLSHQLIDVKSTLEVKKFNTFDELDVFAKEVIQGQQVNEWLRHCSNCRTNSSPRLTCLVCYVSNKCSGDQGMTPVL